MVICDAARSKTLGQGAEWRVWFFIEIIQISWLLFVLSPIQWSSQTKDPIFTCSSAMFHFCMDIRLRLFSSHYMVPCSLGQRTIMNFSSLNYVQAVCPCDQTNFQIEHTFKFRMPAEGRTRPGKSICLAQTGKTHSCRRTWMWLQGGFEQSLLEKVGIFWPHGPWHRFKNQRKGSRKRSRKRSRKKKEAKEGRTEERRREKTWNYMNLCRLKWIETFSTWMQLGYSKSKL